MIPPIDADRHQIGYALDQLLQNATQVASEDGGIQNELNTLAAGIVRAHGVYIYLRSKLDRGSAFKIYLPNG